MADEITPIETTEGVVEETPALDTTAEVIEQPETVESDQPLENDGTDTTDATGKLSADQIKGHIEALKKTNPALAKEIKNLYYSQDALKKLVPGGVPEVKKALETIEALGGSEGIEKINAQRAEWASIDEKFANGDAAVLDEFAKFNPEGYAKLIPASLDKLATLNRDAYNHTLAGPFVATLDAWKLPDTLERLAENLALIVDKDGNKICTREIQALSQLAQKYDALKGLAEQVPVKKVDDATKKLEGERAQIAKERAEVHGQYVATQTEVHAQKQYETLIASEAKNHGLKIEQLRTAGSYERFQRQIDEEVAREIIKDKPAVKKIQDSIQAGRRDEAVKLSNAKFDQVSGRVVQRVVKEWATLMNPSGVRARSTLTNGKNGSSPLPAGVKKLEGPPDLSLVDRKDPNWRDNYMMHSKAVLTTGQRVAW